MSALYIWQFLVAYIAIALYFAPAFIAYRRHHQSRFAILATNLLLGWTVVGGVAALMWSLTSKRVFI